MPMYYFHLHDQERIVDAEGTDLANVAAARAHATGVARELTFNSPGMLQREWSAWTMSVQDAQGNVLFSFPMAAGEA